MQIDIRIFLGVLLIIGLGLTISSFFLASNVADCSIHAQNAVRGLLTMGVSLFSISATMLACKCGANFDKDGPILGNVFPVIVFLIGVITFGLVITIHKECEKARKMTPALITLSFFIAFGAGGYLGVKVYNKVKKPVGSPTPDASPASSAANSESAASSPISLLGG